MVPGIRAGDNRQSDVVVRGVLLGRGLPVVGDMCMMSALHQDGTPWAGAEDYDGVAIERGIAAKALHLPRTRFVRLVHQSSFWSWLARRAAGGDQAFIVR